ncbi:hypothetical protein BC629DRAFT_1542430 [Irpex lacteus]|nr:hypothetical protein BC629DRAFT_1542430 [Irpex lacteus]
MKKVCPSNSTTLISRSMAKQTRRGRQRCASVGDMSIEAWICQPDTPRANLLVLTRLIRACIPF